MERLRECMEELLEFTLNSHVNETLEFDLGLSKNFCSNLLELDQNHAVSHLATATNAGRDSFKGVPQYPLFKCLASALYQSIISGVLYRTYDKMPFLNDDVSLQQRKEKWNNIIQEKGSEIINILSTAPFELHVQEPFFSLLKDGVKTIEGRCAGSKYNRITPGVMILVNKSLVLEVKDVRPYTSFSKMLEAEGLAKVLPGVENIEEGVKIYRKFYTEETETSNGVIAISVLKSVAQPCLSLASLLFELSYCRIQHLLGLAHTTGTVCNMLPPPRAALLSSFMLPYKPNIKGSTLTNGARALAKHTERSGNKYWGILCGNDDIKNRLAMDVIGQLMSSCCWSNMHIIPQHGVVLEIRVADGYGARWSWDGTKFIGFLEPYMEEGHAKGWKL